MILLSNKVIINASTGAETGIARWFNTKKISFDVADPIFNMVSLNVREFVKLFIMEG